MEKKDFSKLCDELEYFCVENPAEKNKDEIMDEIREFIRENGWPCLGDMFDLDEEAEIWFEENHHELPEDKKEETCVCDIEILCLNDFPWDGHDIEWATFNVGFIGEYGKFGTFFVQAG